MQRTITPVSNSGMSAKNERTGGALRLTKIFIAGLILVSCSGGGEKPETVESLRAREAELKTELSDISAKLEAMAGDSGIKSTLVETDVLKPSVFKTYINVQGRVDADESVSLSTGVPGTITKINVKPGDRVSKGDILAETDDRALRQTLSEARTNMELVNQVYEKQKELWDQKIGTEIQYLQAKTNKESTEKRILALEEQIRMTKIISPIDGTVDAVDIKLGQGTAPGAPAIRVINLSELTVKADLAESYAMRVKKGDPVLISFPDAGDTISSRIGYSSRVISPLNRTFEIEVPLNGKQEFHPNQIAILSINDYESSKPVISVDVNHVRKDIDGGLYVMVAENKKAVKKKVSVGKHYGGRAEIVSGLKEGDTLIETGYENLNEGDAIKLKSKD